MAKLSKRVEKEFAWQQLRDQIFAGESGLKIEDEIKGVELKDGQKITLQVVYVSPDGTEVKFVSKNCLKDEYPMNERRTNKGGFMASDLFQRLQTEIFELLPDDLAAVVSEVKRKQIVDGEEKEYSCKLWLPSEMELFGEDYYSTAAAGEEQLEFFKDRRNRIKKLGDEAEYTDFWWCGSPAASNTTYFCIVNYGGHPSISSASTALGVPVCFTIKKS